MFNQEIEYSESDGFIRNKMLFYKSTGNINFLYQVSHIHTTLRPNLVCLSILIDRPVVTNFKPVRGTKFAESVTYSFFKEVFLPQGFPDSVHKDYVPYQIWDTLQVLFLIKVYP